MKADYGIELKFMLTKKLIGNCMRLCWENMRVIMEFMIVSYKKWKVQIFSFQSPIQINIHCCVIGFYLKNLSIIL